MSLREYDAKLKAQTAAAPVAVADAAVPDDGRFSLVMKLISSPDRIEGAALEFRAIEDLVRKDFLRLTSEFSFPGESKLFNSLLGLLDELRDLVEFPHLANKNVLAIGGSFSSGKSRFINAVLGGEQLLPFGINPTTAIPTFVTHGSQEVIRALNTFNRSEPLSRQDFQSISHAFNESENSDSTTVSFYHILKLIQIQSPKFKWKNIAMLDTPGYSKPHTEENEGSAVGTNAGNTDEEKAKEHLAGADYLIWAVPAKHGTVHQDDIDFLRDKVEWNRPVYLLITKCDQPTEKELAAQIKQIRSDFSASFKLAGWSAFSGKSGECYGGDDPRQWFNEINKKCKYTRWRGRFKELIDQIIIYNAAEEENYAKDLEAGFRNLYMNADGLISPENEAKVKILVDKVSQERKSHAGAKKQFANFEERLELKLNAVLSKLGIADETVSDVGLKACCHSPEKEMMKLTRGMVLDGIVEQYTRWNGCFIRAKGIKGEIRISKSDLEKHHTNPQKLFGVGAKVQLKVYEQKVKQGEIIFTVKVV